MSLPRPMRSATAVSRRSGTVAASRMWLSNTIFRGAPFFRTRVSAASARTRGRSFAWPPGGGPRRSGRRGREPVEPRLEIVEEVVDEPRLAAEDELDVAL